MNMINTLSGLRASRRLGLLATAALIAGSGAAQAAEASSTATVDEVVVTARLRSESLNTVPLAVSVVSGAQIAARNLNDLQDIAQTVPTVDFRAGASNKDRTVFIRGLGTITTSPGVEPSVSTVIDGVVLARPGQSTLDLVDVDRIEVLRGPQGTLFGKNASAGVINIVSKDPTDQFHGYADASAYTGGEYRLKGTVSGPIIAGKLDGLVSVLGGHFDGNVRDVLRNGAKINGYGHEGARIKLVANPTDDLKLTWSADVVDGKDTTPNGVFVSTQRVAYPTGVVTPNAGLAALLAAYGVTPGADNRDSVSGLGTSVKDRNYGSGLQADYTRGGYTLTSITGYRVWRNHQIQDFDALPAPSAAFPEVRDDGVVDFFQRSQELRLTSPKGGFVDFVAGLYYEDAQTKELYQRGLTRIVSGTPVNDSGVAHYGVRSKNYAAYGEADVNFSQSLRGLIGGRVIRDELDYYHDRLSTSAVALTGLRPEHHSKGSTSKDGWSGRAGLQYDITSRQMIYATVSRGYKGPAYNTFFNMQAIDEIALKPETSTGFEVGVKGSLHDGMLSGSLALYKTDYENYQANFTDTAGTPPALVTRLINAGSVSSKGFEGDITLRPADDVRLGVSFSSDDARVDSFNCPAGSPVSCNINGRPLPFAPKFKAHADAQYTQHVTSVWDIQYATDYSYKSKTQFSLSETPDTVQPAYGIWNADVALVGKNGWTIRALVKNIAGQHYSQAIAYATLAGVVRFVPRDDERYEGISIRKDF